MSSHCGEGHSTGVVVVTGHHHITAFMLGLGLGCHCHASGGGGFIAACIHAGGWGHCRCCHAGGWW